MNVHKFPMKGSVFQDIDLGHSFDFMLKTG